MSDTLRQCKRKAFELLNKAKENEFVITEVLKQTAQQTQGRLEGLENRFKTEDSLTRKLYDRVRQQIGNFPDEFDKLLAEIAENANDVLRYTIIFENDNYVESIKKFLSILEENHDFKILQIWNAWLTVDTPRDFGYRGINTTLFSSGKYIFELQFHTRQSYNAKQNSHFLYREIRLSTTSKTRRQKLRQKQIERAANIIFPENIRQIGKKK